MISEDFAVQDATGGGYTQYGNMMKVLAEHEQKDLNVTVYKQIWNEPDLTSYFNYSSGETSFFHGTNSDYNAMYTAASTAMKVRTLGSTPRCAPFQAYIQWSLLELLAEIYIS